MGAVGINRKLGQIHEPCDFFCRFSFFDEIGNLDFLLREIQEFQGQLLRKGGNDSCKFDSRIWRRVSSFWPDRLLFSSLSAG